MGNGILFLTLTRDWIDIHMRAAACFHCTLTLGIDSHYPKLDASGEYGT